MKYLKEDLENKNYKLINYNNYDRKEYLFFSKKEIIYIINFIFSIIKENNFIHDIKIQDKYIFIQIKKKGILIRKCQDDYYNLRFDNSTDYIYYSCDQLDGIKNCIKNEIFKRKQG